MNELPPIHLTFWNFLFTGLSFIGTFFSIKLISSSRLRNSAQLALGLYLLLQSLVLLEYCFFWTNYIYRIPWFYASTYLFPFLYGPLLLIYFDSVFDNCKPLQLYALHLIPFLLFFGLKIPFYFSSPETKFHHPEFLPFSYFVNDRIDYVQIIMIIHLLIYGIALTKHVRSFTLVGFMREWTNWILVFFFLFIFLTILYWSIIAWNRYTLLGDYFISLAMCSSIALLAWFGDGYQKLKEGVSISASLGLKFGLESKDHGLTSVLPSMAIESIEGIDVKYKNSGLPESLAQLLAEKLEILMTQEQLYKENDLKLETLAEKLKSNRHFVSQVINQFYQTNFFNFINLKRIEEAKRLLKDGDHKANIIEIAYMVGYNNKGTFNAVFKKLTGVTPTEYRKGIQSST